MAYYVWSGEGRCDDTTDTLDEALQIRTELVQDGYTDAYITRDDVEAATERSQRA